MAKGKRRRCLIFLHIFSGACLHHAPPVSNEPMKSDEAYDAFSTRHPPTGDGKYHHSLAFRKYYMTEIIPATFGDKMNWDNDNDLLIRRLKFLEKSPSPFHSSLLRWQKEWGHTRTQIVERLQRLAIWDVRDKHTPGDGSYVHDQWLKSLGYPDIDTVDIDSIPQARLEDFDLPERSKVFASIVSVTHSDARDVLDPDPGDIPLEDKIVPFPGIEETGFQDFMPSNNTPPPPL